MARSNVRHPQIIFANPHLHHSYFTCLSLSLSNRTLYILCPPLTIQILFNKWRLPLPQGHLSFYQRAITAVGVFAFLLFKTRIIDEDLYLKYFVILFDIFLQTLCNPSVYVYQDYLNKSRVLIAKNLPTYCELIIAVTESSHNYSSTLLALKRADHILGPSEHVFESLPSKSHAIFHYGGDTSEYLNQRHHRIKLSSTDLQPVCLTETPLTIIFRSATYRKGADISFSAIYHLMSLWDSCKSTPFVHIHFAGNIEEPTLRSVYYKLLTCIKQYYPKISLASSQLDQDNYLQMLATADLYVMPSRLEGSSLAALEALWYSVPCIITPQCGVSAFIDYRHGRLLPNHDPTLLASFIHELLENDSLRREISNNLMADRSQFDWTRYLTLHQYILP